jgi:2-dehydro-3-deoxyphosphooctonate aldolase (KDO 8-P synthase)
VKVKPLRIRNAAIGGDKPAFILGPCVIESEKFVWRMARKIAETCAAENVDFIFKASYDKANRTSVRSFRGIGVREGCEILSGIGRELKIPVTTDVHSASEAEIAGEKIDMLQIPAFLCRQTDLLRAAAETGRTINVKKGQFLAPWDMAHVVAKITGAGNTKVLVTERGVSFGYNTLVSDMRALPILARVTGAPVVFDATHSVQQPGGQGTSSGGEREFVPVLARAAVAVGVAGVFIETHQDPDHAPSDGPNMVPLKDMEKLLRTLVEYDRLSKA